MMGHANPPYKRKMSALRQPAPEAPPVLPHSGSDEQADDRQHENRDPDDHGAEHQDHDQARHHGDERKREKDRERPWQRHIGAPHTVAVGNPHPDMRLRIATAAVTAVRRDDLGLGTRAIRGALVGAGHAGRCRSAAGKRNPGHFRRAASTLRISSSITGLFANGTKRTGGLKLISLPKLLDWRNISVTRGGLMSGE